MLAFSAGWLPFGNLAFPGSGGILEGIMLLVGKNIRYVPQRVIEHHQRNELIPA
jgi:hypothetical protein